MLDVMPVLLKDGYKVGHKFQYPEGTELVYSNLTPRASRIQGSDEMVFFGLQYFIKEYLIRQFNDNFFDRPVDEVVRAYKRRIDNYLGPDAIPVDHIGALHELGHLPLHIKALAEGTSVPMRVPVLTIHNTESDFFWLTNALETLLSNVLWMPCTSATIAQQYWRRFKEYERMTMGEVPAEASFVPYQGHDFSFRGMAGPEAAMLSGAGHLLSFSGTDTIPAIDFLEAYYNADSDTEIIGVSVAATEHSVMCAGGQDGELETIRRLITEVVPTGIVSIVCDTWDFWHVLTDTLPKLKNEIMNREGKVVVRPDSGDPVKIICGDPGLFQNLRTPASPEERGAVEVLFDTFGGEVNAKGYITLDPHVGLIYGDSINLERQEAILHGLAAKGYSSYNVVLGIGSFTYQHNTRDTYGLAVKATYCEVNGEGRMIFKSPKTDDGTKNSAKGPLKVLAGDSGKLVLVDEVPWHEIHNGLLEDVFWDGDLMRDTSLHDIRTRVHA
jgi:nicotinamide phosphoribosyltransferase